MDLKSGPKSGRHAWYAHLRNLGNRPWYVVVFAPFAVLYMRQPMKLDYLWAALCVVDAVYFVFRSPAS